MAPRRRLLTFGATAMLLCWCAAVTVGPIVGGAEAGLGAEGAAAYMVRVRWGEPPLAVTPIVNSWHDTPQGAQGNPHHDSVYPPTSYDIVDAINSATA